MPGAVLVVQPRLPGGWARIVGACDSLSTIGVAVEKAEWIGVGGHQLFEPAPKLKAPGLRLRNPGARAALPQNCPRCESIALQPFWQEILGNPKVMQLLCYGSGSAREDISAG
jgi:hypothetical protein